MSPSFLENLWLGSERHVNKGMVNKVFANAWQGNGSADSQGPQLDWIADAASNQDPW
jgi:hypothetical protein